MAALPYMQLYPADYLADTQHLTTEEHGAYLLLLMNYWQTGKPLRNSEGRLAIIAKLSNERWTAVEPSLREFFSIRRSIWHHRRMDFDLQSVLDKSTKASFAGKESARKRANSRLKPANERSTDDEQTYQRNGNHTDTRHQTPKDSSSAISSQTKEAFDLCNLLADSVETNLREKSKNPEKVKRPEISKAWVTQMNLLIRKDGHSADEVREIIEWSQNDEFWSSNVMSPAKLRKQFDQLILKMPIGPIQPKAKPHTRLEDKNGAYCGSCHQTWPCLTESKKGGNPF